MEEKYSKNFPALSPEQQAILKKKKVFIAGAGGLGGYLLEFMLRLGTGSVKICDGDSFSLSNLNRQLLSSSENIGKSKVSAAKIRAEAIAAGTDFEAVSEYISAKNAEELIKGADAVLDGLDNIPGRRLLYSACEKLNIPYIYGAVSGFTAQAAVLLPGSKTLDTLYPKDINPESGGILSFTPALGAAMQCSLCLKLLCGEAVESGRLYCMDLYSMDFKDFLLD